MTGADGREQGEGAITLGIEGDQWAMDVSPDDVLTFQAPTEGKHEQPVA